MLKPKQLLNIVYYPDPVLLKDAVSVQKITNETRNFISDMIHTMKKRDGVGIAAPQVGVPSKIVVCALSKGIVALINPIITSKSLGTETGTEGCLSLPGLYGEVECAKEVTVEFLNYKGKVEKMIADGKDSRILQHEIAHLHGLTILDTADSESFVWITGEEDADGELIEKPVSLENAKRFFERLAEKL